MNGKTKIGQGAATSAANRIKQAALNKDRVENKGLTKSVVLQSKQPKQISQNSTENKTF